MIYLNVDLAAILELRNDLEPKVRQVLRDAARDLSHQTHAHIAEEVNQKLHSTRDKYQKALKIDEVDDETFLITLDRSAMWIEEGLGEHEMIDDLLKSPKTKTAKDGSRYLAVPFQHNKGPTSQTPAQTDLTNTLRAELKRRNIPYGKLEMGANGPKLGLLHKFDIMRMPTKTQEGPGMGKGPLGAVRQGPTGIPFLQHIRIYQKQIVDPETNKSRVVKNIMTFRMVSSKHKGSGRWVHPGLEAKHFFEEAQKWAENQWETRIVPDIMKRLNAVL